jgi:hypothetical protein
LALVVSVQSYFQGSKIKSEYTYHHYNNYIIFKQSFYHLLDGTNLYQPYPEESADLYKYSPTFSLFFGLLAWLPDLAGLIIWNLLNALVLFFAIKSIPGLTHKAKVWLSLFVLFEMVGSLQNSQSNALTVGLIILAFSFLEKKKYFWASFFIVFPVFIKLFGIVAFTLYIFYPNKPKLLLFTAFWFVFLVFSPLVFTSFSGLLMQYNEWGNLLTNDHSISQGISIFGIIQSWFNIHVSKIYILFSGILLFLLPLIRFKKYDDLPFRLLMLASILIWVIVFNHKAESPTFVIAMCGIGIYLFSGSFTKAKMGLMVLSLLLTSLMFQDFIPKTFRNEYIIAYNLKVLPSVVVWLFVIVEMLNRKNPVETEKIMD